MSGMSGMSVIVNCMRCHIRCQTGTPDPTARLLRISATSGYCVNCAVTDWLRSCDVIADTIAHVREQFARIMATGNAQVRPEQIDWDEIIANWGLPFPERAGRKPGSRS